MYSRIYVTVFEPIHSVKKKSLTFNSHEIRVRAPVTVDEKLYFGFLK